MTTKTANTKAVKTTVIAPHPGAEIGVYGHLRKGVNAHRLTINTSHTDPTQGNVRWQEATTAACTGKPVRTHSYGFAKSQGAIVCRKCFGGDR